ITGGKLTTYRLMAEKTCDMVCSKLNCPNECQTHILSLPATADGDWSEPGIMGPSVFQPDHASDPMLCECEMVPASAVDTIVKSLEQGGLTPDLSAIGLRSRIGKGPCQGAFCSLRVQSHLHDSGVDAGGLGGLKRFLDERWKGEQPLLWDRTLAQSALKDMIHCGLFGLEQVGKGGE
ncbi:MAG: anaerobic glycerol-3-phosphate dehydrogenase subunit A, partial [Desulfobacterales bacterium]|nr:anaerobic glycerol-3-phosphate dehydrogenase subunit A [Desulfobacterales bacterium]